MDLASGLGFIGFRQCFFGCGVVAVEAVIRVQFRV